LITSRRRPITRRADSEWLVVYAPLAGSLEMTWWRREARLRPGQFGLVSTIVPLEVRVSRRARSLTVYLPPELLDGPPNAGIALARILSANPAFHFLIQHLKLTLQLGRSLDGHACDAAKRAASELLAAALSSADPESAECHDAVRIAQLKHYIDRSLAMPSLSVAQVAAANFVSPRAIQRLFSATGETTSAYIRRCWWRGWRAGMGGPLAIAGAAGWGQDVLAAHGTRLPSLPAAARAATGVFSQSRAARCCVALGPLARSRADPRSMPMRHTCSVTRSWKPSASWPTPTWTPRPTSPSCSLDTSASEAQGRLRRGTPRGA
jgi:hypothetical protein